MRRELHKRRHEALRLSLDNPHPETAELAEQGLEEWARSLPAEDTEGLIDPAARTAIRWVRGDGWIGLGA